MYGLFSNKKTFSTILTLQLHKDRGVSKWAAFSARPMFNRNRTREGSYFC